ncbi:MAG: HIT domain-containing protein [Bacteroidales bacterium]|nr:HIT domain-containing protein [Bacteroidales bacterium]
MASIFSKIVAGEIPCHRVAETDHCLAFLDINPVVRGHVLCIPKKEVDNLFDLDPQLYDELMRFARRVAKGVSAVCLCKKVGVAVVGLDVPHAHVHLLPLNEPSDFSFSHHVSMTPEELARLAADIAAAVE